MVGRFTLALALTAPVFMLTNLNLSAIQATDARGEYSFGEYLGLRLTCSALGIVVVPMILWFGHYSGPVWLIALLVALAKAIESISDIAQGLVQQHERMDWVARSLVLKGGLSVAAVTAGLWFSRNLAVAVGCLIGAWLVVLLIYDLPRAGRFASLRPSFRWPTLCKLGWVALPLGIVGGLGALNIDLPRIFVEKHFGEKELGILGAISSLAAAGRIVSIALSRSAAPRLAQLLARGMVLAFRRLLWKLILSGSAIGLLGLLGASLFGRTFLSLVYTPDYAQRNDLLMWVMATSGLVAAGSFLGTACTAMRIFRSQMGILLGKLLINSAVCLLFVPGFGSLAAAWAVFTATAFSALAHGWLVHKGLRRLAKSANSLLKQ